MKGPLTPEEGERCKALRADGESFYSIGKKVQRSIHTVKSFLSKPENTQDVADRKPKLAIRYKELAARILGSVTEEDIRKANLTAKLIASGIAIDKATLLENGTPNLPNITILLQIADTIRERRDRPTLPLVIPSMPEDPQ